MTMDVATIGVLFGVVTSLVGLVYWISRLAANVEELRADMAEIKAAKYGHKLANLQTSMSFVLRRLYGPDSAPEIGVDAGAGGD